MFPDASELTAFIAAQCARALRLQLGTSVQSDASPSSWQCLRNESCPVLGIQASDEISPDLNCGRGSPSRIGVALRHAVERPRTGVVRKTALRTRRVAGKASCEAWAPRQRELVCCIGALPHA